MSRFLTARSTRSERLTAFLESQPTDLPRPIGSKTSLIKSGALDSLALFNLAAWIESELGCAIDLTAFDLPEEWDTIEGILHFIERRGRRD